MSECEDEMWATNTDILFNALSMLNAILQYLSIVGIAYKIEIVLVFMQAYCGYYIQYYMCCWQDLKVCTCHNEDYLMMRVFLKHLRAFLYMPCLSSKRPLITFNRSEGSISKSLCGSRCWLERICNTCLKMSNADIHNEMIWTTCSTLEFTSPLGLTWT